ncbi:Hypothetical predicted protein [Mytilus galloprovincialis]|uniref:Uncharacterized protein n=1 Tax=Mytilus galloprovincialis TaxID=29158 RepID=A0A8B6BMI4_MYTGA|nr:Hypothetical predicted protein [Mytilus galloprovincialis]
MPVPYVSGEGDDLWESDLEDPALDTLTDELDASEMHAVEEGDDEQSHNTIPNTFR